MKYKCEKCNKEFLQRGHYMRHINRKTDCSMIDVKLEKQEDNLTCERCNKTFSSRTSKWRHQKKYCKPVSMEEEIVSLKKKITELSKKKSTINIKNTIEINPFGKENIEYIKDEYLRNAIKMPQYGLPNLIRLIHFNKEHPENMNIKQKNKKKPLVDIYNGKEWVTMDKEDTIHNIVATKKEIMDEYIDKNPQIEYQYKNNYERFSYSVDEYLKGQLPKLNCFDKTELTTKCRDLYKNFINKIDILLINRGLYPQ